MTRYCTRYSPMLAHIAASSKVCLQSARVAAAPALALYRPYSRGALALPLLFLLGATPLTTTSSALLLKGTSASSDLRIPSLGAVPSIRPVERSSASNNMVFRFGQGGGGSGGQQRPSNPNLTSPIPSSRGRRRGGGGPFSPAAAASSDGASSDSPSVSSSSNRRPTRWSDAANDAVRRCVPPLSYSSHKGSSGRVGVLGGSKRYTGAPYYAAMASLKVGADLAFVFTAEEAAVPIKCYSPELMVMGVYGANEFDKSIAELEEAKQGEGKEEEVERILREQERLIEKMVTEVTSLFDRMHVLIIGPGLGRCPLVLRATARIIDAARAASLPLVVDADGLYLLNLEENADLVAGYRGLVLTPNAVEVKRLAQSLGSNYAKVRPDKDAKDMDDEELTLTSFDRATEGNVLVKKGHHDVIFSVSTKMDDEGKTTVSRASMLCEEEGGLKRSGGLGDILSGAIGTFVAWNRILARDGGSTTSGGDFGPEDLLLACWSACCVTKRGTKMAYQKRRRAMTAPDVLEEIGKAVDDMTGEANEETS